MPSPGLSPRLRALLVFLLVAGLGVAGLFAVAQWWPLPKGQGLAYVAHPFWALIGAGGAALVALLGCLTQPQRWYMWLIATTGASWLISALIFLSA